jgi:hypothetical protein
MHFTISDLVELLRLKHSQMLLRGASPRWVDALKNVETIAPELQRQVVPHKPADDHRLRASHL